MISLTELPGITAGAKDGTRKMWAHFNDFFAEQAVGEGVGQNDSLSVT